MQTSRHTHTRRTRHYQWLITGALICTASSAAAADDGWSVVSHLGLSELGDQSAAITADGIASGSSEVTVDSGFSAGVSFRYDYTDSRWTSEFGWEYRSNDTRITDASSTELPGGNYASNTFFLNGRYALTDGRQLTPWIGGGLSWIQEVDLDSETTPTERSFSDGGDVGFQLMAGADYHINDRFYLTGELRYTSFTGIDLTEEGGDGNVTNIDYQPVTLGLGIGYRF